MCDICVCVCVFIYLHTQARARARAHTHTHTLLTCSLNHMEGKPRGQRKHLEKRRALDEIPNLHIQTVIRPVDVAAAIWYKFSKVSTLVNSYSMLNMNLSCLLI